MTARPTPSPSPGQRPRSILRRRQALVLPPHEGARPLRRAGRTHGETQARAILVAERLGTLLRQGTVSIHDSIDRLDLAAPLPETKLWPPVFSGEPASHDAEAAMNYPLCWTDLNAVASWARQLAYFLSGLHGHPPQGVRAVAIVRLRRLIEAAARGLVTGSCATDAPPEPTRAPRTRRTKKGGAT